MKMAPSTSSSILSLQELIKLEPLISIPDQYIHLDQETICMNTPFPKIPIIDLKRLISIETMDVELEKLHSTCKEWGIFQLVNHGVDSSLLEELKNEIEEFYKLPLEEKMRYKMRQGDVEGYGTVTRFGGKDLDWGDRFYMITNPIHRRKSHLFPELPSSLRDNLEDYLQEMQKLVMRLLRFLAMALEMDLKEMEETFDDGMQSMRMTYYPPCLQPELVIGLTPHSDASGITILNQINGVDGLQIKKDGVWIPITIPSNSLVVNLGDILEIMSNGVYKSIEHRVVVNSKEERVSLAFFVNPRFEAEVGPAKSITSPQNPPIFTRKGMETYFKEFFARKLNGKTFLEHMKIIDHSS